MRPSPLESTLLALFSRLLAALLIFCSCALSAGRAAFLPAADAVALAQRAADAAHAALLASSSPVRVLSAALDGPRLTLDLSREALAFSPGSLRFELMFAPALRAAGDVLREPLATFEVHLAIEGVPLNRLLTDNTAPPAPPTARQLAPRAPDAPPFAHPLTGRRIAISPGHGYYLNGSTFVLQRSYFSGIVEDFVNHDFITYLHALLAADGADVRSTRNLDRAAGLGETGFAKWQEAARYHVKALGADASVWNESGFTPLEQDIRCRPRYANAVNAELLVSIHNNGGGGTGTETLYDTNNGFGAESKRLADLLHTKVITAIRRDYNPTWADRRVQGFNGSYGENRLATRPAVILEIAFMDRPTPDNAALQDERFKQLVATAIRDGIREFLVGPNPAAPDALLATAEAGGLSLAWTDHSTNEAGFTIERKLAETSTEAWTRVGSVAANLTTFRDTTTASGLTYVYRVQAFHAGGSVSDYSNEATAALATPPLTLVLASVVPADRQTLAWDQTAEFALTVTDTAGRPVSDASISIRDGLRNTTATLVTDVAGRASYRTRVPVGQAEVAYTLTFRASKPAATASDEVTRDLVVVHRATLTVGAPTILAQPLSQTVTTGMPVSFVVNTALSGSPLPSQSYQWHFNGSPLAGATRPALALPPVTAAQAGAYSVTVTTSAGTATSLPASLTVTPAAWLSNVSLRTTLAPAQTVIVGFVMSGGAKDLLVRAAGPALAAFGLTTAMPDPRLALFRDATPLTVNNDWPAALAPAFAALGAFPFPTASRDAALLRSLGGAHTVQVSGPAGGLVLVEGYDAGSGSATRLINLSARNRVGTGADILIAGFYVAGTGTKRLLIRAIGPTLAALGVSGVLADPQLELTDVTGRLASNDNWDASLATTFASVGAFPLPAASNDAAVVVALAASRSYTVQVSGVANTVGEALVEVYELP